MTSTHNSAISLATRQGTLLDRIMTPTRHHVSRKQDPVWFSLATQNTFAIALMEQGQLENATELLSEILTDIQERCEDVKLWKGKRRKIPLETVALENPNETRDAASTGGKVFHRVFHLPQDKPVGIDVIVAIVLFNYAVATHIMSIQEDSKSDPEKAFKIYRKVLSVETSRSESDLLDPVVAAAMHNMSVICSACNLDSKARHLQGLLSVVLERSTSRFDVPEARAFFIPRATAA